MTYTFFCKACNTTEERDIPMSQYDEQKNHQRCNGCGGLMQRKIEWQGYAQGSGEGWFGKDNGASKFI